MSTVVILDADFLSAFLKIERLSLLLSFYQVERLHIPAAVYRELAVTNLLPSLLAFPWITVEQPAPDRLAAVVGDEALSVLGAGEQEAIALAMEYPGSILLSNDRQVKRLAASCGVTIINIPAFLLACKLAGLQDQPELQEIIVALQEKDHYGFRSDILDMILG